MLETKKYAQIQRYAMVSVTATVLDFSLFQVGLWISLPIFWATALGVAVSGVLQWWLCRVWVFRAAEMPLAWRFALGIGLGLVLNSFGTKYLSLLLGGYFWVSRVVTALTVWRVLYGFNARLVFRRGVVE